MSHHQHFNPDGPISVKFIDCLQTPGPRETGNAELLRLEHEAIVDGRAIGNPAEPKSDDAIPTAVTDAIAALDTVDEVQAFIEREAERGPREYVVGLANQRRQALQEASADA